MATSVDATVQFETDRPPSGRGKKLGVVVLLLILAFVVYASLRPLSVLRAAGRFALWCGGIRGHYAQVGPYRVRYYDGGEGPPVVFVHGLGAESLNWVPAMLDLRGVGAWQARGEVVDAQAGGRNLHARRQRVGVHLAVDRTTQ